MQRALIAFALLCAPAASLSTTAVARLFLRSHAASPPQADELAELNHENPEAYALVKALLTKRSLGLLNSRHPTASFAAPSADQQNPEEQGPEAFAKFASPEELAAHGHALSAAPEVAMPYAEVQPAAHHDFMNWRPQNSGMDDEQMVQNVLGAVAELKGGKKAGLLSKSRSNSESSLAADEASFSVEEPVAVSAKPVAAPAAPQENSYLKSVDFGIRAPEAKVEEAAAPSQHKNSYLDGLDLTGDMPKVEESVGSKKTSQAQSSSNSYLASFSWDDSKPKEESQPQVVKPAEPKANSKDNTLMSWLGVSQKAEPKPAPVAPAAPANPYLMDLS